MNKLPLNTLRYVCCILPGVVFDDRLVSLKPALPLLCDAFKTKEDIPNVSNNKLMVLVVIFLAVQSFLNEWMEWMYVCKRV